MKKGTIRFLATGMTALTLMGTTVAFAPPTQVYAAEAEAETASDVSESTRELKIMSAKEADAYLKELVGDTAPFQEYEKTKMYRVGNHVYSVSIYDQGMENINKTFINYDKANEYYNECCEKGIINGNLKVDCDLSPDGYLNFISATVTGKMPMVNLLISTYPIKPVDTITITAHKTMIRPGESTCLQLHVNDGADEFTVSWRMIDPEGIADFYVDGVGAFVTGCEPGTVLVVAETEEGVMGYIHINIGDF